MPVDLSIYKGRYDSRLDKKKEARVLRQIKKKKKENLFWITQEGQCND